jgi:translin
MKNIFSNIMKVLDEINDDRERVLNMSRNIVRKCSRAIKSIHREEFDEYQHEIDNIKNDLDEIRGLINKHPGYLYKYLKTPEQEYAEATILFAIIKNSDIPTHVDLNIDPLHYSLGCADVVGELRRHILDIIRQEDTGRIDELLEQMDEIYSHLFSMDYPSGLTKDLRHKTDVARKLVEKTRGDISLSIQMNNLSELLKKKTD